MTNISKFFVQNQQLILNMSYRNTQKSLLKKASRPSLSSVRFTNLIEGPSYQRLEGLKFLDFFSLPSNRCKVANVSNLKIKRVFCKKIRFTSWRDDDDLILKVSLIKYSANSETKKLLFWCWLMKSLSNYLLSRENRRRLYNISDVFNGFRNLIL